jgi:hypothetical protein
MIIIYSSTVFFTNRKNQGSYFAHQSTKIATTCPLFVENSKHVPFKLTTSSAAAPSGVHLWLGIPVLFLKQLVHILKVN